MQNHHITAKMRKQQQFLAKMQSRHIADPHIPQPAEALF